jgi:hypothetical protein
MDEVEAKVLTDLKGKKKEGKGYYYNRIIIANDYIEEAQSPTDAKPKQKGDQLETFNPVETSRQVLHSCNILRRKNAKVKEIHRGEGHLISTLDRSISEMYLDIYNIDITKEGGKAFRVSKSVKK